MRGKSNPSDNGLSDDDDINDCYVYVRYYCRYLRIYNVRERSILIRIILHVSVTSRFEFDHSHCRWMEVMISCLKLTLLILHVAYCCFENGGVKCMDC